MKGRFVFPAIAIVLAVLGVSAFAGDLNPPGPPAPTMKTLDRMAPTWDQVLPATDRFKLVMGATAVLDKETGLVWESSPGTEVYDWQSAHSVCQAKTVGGRKGWRLPWLEELASLIDPSVPSPGPRLPSGYSSFFSNVRTIYWSATVRYGFSGWAYPVGFDYEYGPNPMDQTYGVWCVRTARGADSQP